MIEALGGLVRGLPQGRIEMRLMLDLRMLVLDAGVDLGPLAANPRLRVEISDPTGFWSA